MALWRRDQGGESRNEGQRSQFHRRGAVRPRFLELQLHGSVVEDLEPVVGEGRAQDVLAQGQTALLVVGGDLGRGVKIEPLSLGAQVAFGRGTVVGVEHDAQGLTLVGGAGRLGACCCGGQQFGQQWVLFTEGFVGDNGDFTVAWGGHEGDGTAALEEAEDALAGALNDLLDVVLRGGRRWVEHAALAIAVGRVDAILC
jgi:hypothetical protein